MLEALLSDAGRALAGAAQVVHGPVSDRSNPLTPDEVVMFDMVDREQWSDDRCRQYILDRLHQPA